MPQRIDLDKRRNLLAEAVWRTIREHGMASVSIRTVAATAGVAVGSLRHVFPTREELVRFSAELMVQRATERILATPRTSEPIADAMAMLAHTLPLEEDSRAELDVNLALIGEAPALPALVPIRDHAYRQLGVLCERVVEMVTGDIADGRLEIEARRLHALLDGLAVHLLMEPAGESPDWALSLLRDELVRIAGPARR